MCWKLSLRSFIVCVLSVVIPAGASPTKGVEPGSLDPCGEIHIPIGIANSLDTLKTFVEIEGNFSPGVGSFGIYFWLFDKTAGRLIAPTMDDVACEYGLSKGRYLIPWAKWSTGAITVKTKVCEVKRSSPEGDVFVVGSRVTLENNCDEDRDIILYVALRPLGPAGFDVRELAVSKKSDALLVDGHTAIVAMTRPSLAGVLATDTISDFALRGRMPDQKYAASSSGDCSGAMRFDLTLPTGRYRTLGFVCPVLSGRRAVGHQWDGISKWAQFDLAELNPDSGGVLQPDPGLEYYRKLNVSELFEDAEEYWRQLIEQIELDLPDDRWEEAFAAIIAHVALAMNEGTPDVAVMNYNVFNRDGVYVANIFQKSANSDLSVAAINYFIKHPFNGRSYPEADNPGQILWAMGQQWRFTKDKAWLERIYPSARRIAAMVEYYRTTNGPHWVQMDGLDFGPELPEDKRRELIPGKCDGQHPEYTEAFDIAGLYAAATLAKAADLPTDVAKWRTLADRLLGNYDRTFGSNLDKGYGSYAVLWPCRLYPLDKGKANRQFTGNGKQRPGGWRYFPLAKAHQGLLAGNREAGYSTVQLHLAHEQMEGWYAFDEGGKSGSGGWSRVRTTWNGNIAMPHGWVISELWLLMRDCLVFENASRLVLLSGVPPAWLAHEEGITIADLPTYFGRLNLQWKPMQDGATLILGGCAKPSKGFLLRLPKEIEAQVMVNNQIISPEAVGEFLLPSQTTKARVIFKRSAFE